jgi:three-Cys-motif partner protein
MLQASSFIEWAATYAADVSSEFYRKPLVEKVTKVMSRVAEHRFGGPWTEIKLDAVEYYLRFYASALKAKGFSLWYIDAFAGSGSREVDREVGGILEGAPIETRQEVLAGSARRALAIDPAFHRFVFIERDERRHNALQTMAAQHPGRRIEVINGDANETLLRLLSTPPWNRGSPPAGHRGVLFLDPYAMTVPWTTLQAISATRALDTWYLFPLGAVGRQLAHDFAAVDMTKANALDRIFGTPDWRTALYQQDNALDLFGAAGRSHRKADVRGVERWFHQQLETLFPYVPPPIPIITDTGHRSFSLFFAMASENPKAISAAKSCMRSLSRQFGDGASRQTSGP